MDISTISGMAITGIDTGNSITYVSSPSYTYSIATSIPSQISSLNIDTSTFKIHLPEEWVNQFPDFDRVQKMCKEYPGLAIAFDKFKTTYKLVRDDYDTPKDKRPKP